jgi:hypothetical protein
MSANADRREHDRRGGREQRRLPDGDEVHPTRDCHALWRESVHRWEGDGREQAGEHESGQQTISHTASIDRGW